MKLRVDPGAERTKVQVFAMRLDGERGGVPPGLSARHTAGVPRSTRTRLRLLRWRIYHAALSDNLPVRCKILRGHRREETVRFMAFRSHWRFAAEFCTPGEGHEKGGVEGEGGYFRRNHLVPVPEVADLDALNALLLNGCRADEARVLDGRTDTIGTAMSEERPPATRTAEGFDLAEVVFPLVDKQGCVTVKTNFYSVPIRAGSRVEARIRPLHVEIWHAGRLIARHERCHRRRQHVLDLDHYLDVLSHKPGAFAGSKPLAQWREAGRWPACYDTLWDRLRSRHGKQDGTRAMVAVLALGQEFDTTGCGPRSPPRHRWGLRRCRGPLSADRGRIAQSTTRTGRCWCAGPLRPAAAKSR